jgi:hypothetical protein
MHRLIFDFLKTKVGNCVRDSAARQCCLYKSLLQIICLQFFQAILLKLSSVICLDGLQSLTWVRWIRAAFTSLGLMFCFFVPSLTNAGHQVAMTSRYFVMVPKISEACNVNAFVCLLKVLFQQAFLN